MKQGWFNALTFMTSASTLVCCALPALFVTLGMGAALGTLVTHVPQLQWFGMHKGIIFAVSGVMLALAGIMQYRARFAPCPIDPELARLCMRTRKINRIIYAVSVVIFLVGYFFAFWAARLLV